MARALFADQGFKLFAMNATMRRIADDMRAAKARKDQLKRERLELIKARHAQPALDIKARHPVLSK